MKITQTATTVIAESETIAEALVLLKFGGGAKKRVGRNNYKGKHRQACIQCGKKYKNIKLHQYKAHNISPVVIS